MDMNESLSPLLALPAELIQHILAYLPTSILLDMLPVNTALAASILSSLRLRILQESPMSSAPIFFSLVPPALAYARRSAICSHLYTPGLEKIDCWNEDALSESESDSSTSGSESESELEPSPRARRKQKPTAQTPGQDILSRVKTLHSLCTHYEVSAPSADYAEPTPRSIAAPPWTSEAPRFAVDHPDERFTTALVRVTGRKGFEKKWAVRLFRADLYEASLANFSNGTPVNLFFGHEKRGDGVLATVERSTARAHLAGWQREDPGEEWYQLRVLQLMLKPVSLLRKFDEGYEVE